MTIAGVHVDIGHEAVVVRADEPLTTASSAVVGGGLGRASAIVNLHVPKNFRREHLDRRDRHCRHRPWPALRVRRTGERPRLGGGPRGQGRPLAGRRPLDAGARVRRLPLVGFVVSAVAHVVAVMLLILVVERLTSLPGLFIDLTTEATEANGPTKPAVGSRAERKPSGTRAKRAPASSPGASRASGGDSAPARAVAPAAAPGMSPPL